MSDTAARLLTLLSLLQVRRDWPGADLAERLGVSPRTVRRDVDRLRGLGYPVVTTKGPDGGYRLSAGSELPPLLFDDEQAVALVVALQTSTTGGTGIQDAAARALTTVRQVLPAHLRARVEALQVVAVERSDLTGDQPVDTETLLAISTATRAREVLRFDYAPRPHADDAPDGPQRRRVEPHSVATWQQRWYLIAWDLDRAAWRTFRVDRMTPAANTGPRFRPRELPGGDVRTFLARRFQGLERSGDWPCRGEAILSLPASKVAPFARDAVVTPLDDGRCRVECGSWSWTALAADLGRFDTDIEVIGPAELRAACGRLAERYANTHPSKPEQSAV